MSTTAEPTQEVATTISDASAEVIKREIATHNPNKFSVEDPNFEQRLQEFSAKQRDQKKQEIKSLTVGTEPAPEKSVSEPAVVATLKESKSVEKKLETGISATSTDDDLAADLAKHSRRLDPDQLAKFKAFQYETRDQKRALKERDEKLTAATTKLAELEKQIPTTSSERDALAKELESARRRIEEQETELGASRYKATDKYKREIGEPMSKLVEDFKQIGADYEISPDDIMRAATLRGKARDTAMADLTLEMPSYTQQKFFAMVDKYSDLHNADREIEQAGKAAYDAKLQTDREAKLADTAKRNAARKDALPKVWEDQIVKHASFLKPEDGNEDWNQTLAASQRYAETADFNSEPPEKQVELLYRAAVHPLVLGQVQKLESENGKLKAQIAALKGAKPSAANGSHAAVATAAKADDNDTFEQRFVKKLRGMGLQ